MQYYPMRISLHFLKIEDNCFLKAMLQCSVTYNTLTVSKRTAQCSMHVCILVFFFQNESSLQKKIKKRSIILSLMFVLIMKILNNISLTHSKLLLVNYCCQPLGYVCLTVSV